MSMHRCAGGASASAAPGPQPVAAAPAWRAIPCAGCRPRACSLASPGASPPQQPHSCPTWCIALSVAAARRPAARCRRLRCRAGPRGLSGPAQVLVGAAGLVSADVRAHLIFCLAGLAVIGVVKVNVDGLERNEQARGAARQPRNPDEDPPGGAPKRQSRDLRNPRRLE